MVPDASHTGEYDECDVTVPPKSFDLSKSTFVSNLRELNTQNYSRQQSLTLFLSRICKSHR